MRTFAVLFMLLLALACSATAQEKAVQAPKKPLDLKNPESVAEHLIHNTRGQKSYDTRFSAKLTLPAGDPVEYEGTCLWVAPGLLFIHYTASGGDEKNIVRVGDVAWVHHPFAGWSPAREAGLNGAGRGIQNPNEVLNVLRDHLKGAKFADDGTIVLEFAGKSIERVMREQGRSGEFDWAKSQASITLTRDGETRLKKFVCKADLKSTNPAVKGRVAYEAQVAVQSYNTKTDYTFRDDENKPLKLDEPIIKAIESLRKEQN